MALRALTVASSRLTAAVATAAAGRAGMRAASAAAAAATPRPFRVLGVQQVAVGGTDKNALAALWVDTLGLTRVSTYRAEKENVDEDVLRCGRGPFAVEVDIMQPIDAAKSPKVHEPALNHVGLWIDDLPAAVKWLTEAGVRFAPGGIRRGASGFDVTFIHPRGSATAPKSGEGVLIELVQAPKEVIAAFNALA